MEDLKDLAQLIAEAIMCEVEIELPEEISVTFSDGVLASKTVPEHLRHLYIFAYSLARQALVFEEKGDPITAELLVGYSNEVQILFGLSLKQHIAELETAESFEIVSDWKIMYQAQTLN